MAGPAQKAPRRAARSGAGGELTLLDAFELRFDGQAVRLPMPAQRLLAYLALQVCPLHRTYLAAALWLDSTEAHASGSLRSALWRLRRSGHDLVEETNQRLRLSRAVLVDVREAYAWADRIQDRSTPIRPADVDEASRLAELLRDWYDDWLVLERERFRELRAHALELLCERLAAAGRFSEAMEVGLAAVRNEPLRDSAHRAVIGVHLAEGNRAEAFRHYASYRQSAADELGLDPSPRMEALVRGS
jgi:DNA-binding SARP family transcriptional activator